MSTPSLTGLGEPEPIGKRALFRPPPPVKKVAEKKSPPPTPPVKTAKQPKPISSPKRVHVTTDLSISALSIIQELKDTHRLRTGKVLPLWKIISQAVEFYGESKGIHKDEK